MQPSRRRPGSNAVGLLAAVSLVLAVIGCSGVASSADGGRQQPLRMIIPTSAGGGYDLTGRAAAKTLEDNDLASRVEITNVIGANGAVAMQRLHNEAGADDLVMLMGLGVVGGIHTNRSDIGVAQLTPIARLVEEQEAILVPADSELRTVDDLVDAWTTDPAGLRVGGGSGAGGPDHLFPMRLAAEIGIDPGDVEYVSYDGGGPLTTALLGDRIDIGVSGLAEFSGQIENGSLRVLAVSGEEPPDRVDAPTLTAAGIDLVFTNWRGVLAPPGIDAERRRQLIDAFAALRATDDWHRVLDRYGWSDSFLTGKEFGAFLEQEDARVADALGELGLT